MTTEENNDLTPEANEAKEYFREVTNTVCGTVERPIPQVLVPDVRRRLAAARVAAVVALHPVYRRCGRLGQQQHRGLGLADRQLRLLDRNRSRGNPDLGDSVPDAPALAHQHQPPRPRR